MKIDDEHTEQQREHDRVGRDLIDGRLLAVDEEDGGLRDAELDQRQHRRGQQQDQRQDAAVVGPEPAGEDDAADQAHAGTR